MKKLSTFLEETKPQFMGKTVHIVNHDTYCCCLKGKKHGDRWVNYVDDEAMRETLKREYYKQKSIILQSELTGSMTEFKRNN